MTVALGAEMIRRGLKVMTVKHGHGFRLDQPGRDSWRHRHEGGAFRTVVAGPDDFGVLGRWPGQEMSLVEIVERFLWDADFVLAEGFKSSPEPKIEVVRRASSSEPLLGSGMEGSSRILAVVTDRTEWEVPVPLFDLDSPTHPQEVVEFLLREVPPARGEP